MNTTYKRKAIARLGRKHYLTEITADQHTIYADEPIDLGGTDQGPTPDDLIMSSLAACTAITLRMYADRKEWPLEEIIATVGLIRKEESGQKSSLFDLTLEFIGDLDDEQKQRLLQIAKACPTHKLLTNPTEIKTQLIA